MKRKVGKINEIGKRDEEFKHHVIGPERLSGRGEEHARGGGQGGGKGGSDHGP